MKIKINQEVVWLGKKFTVTAIRPYTFAMLLLTDDTGHEELLLNNYVEEFYRENLGGSNDN